MVAQWARIEAARLDTSVSRLLGELLKERMSAQDDYQQALRALLGTQTFPAQHQRLSDARGGS